MIQINAAQRLFIIPCGEGYSCLGFDNLFDRIREIAVKLCEKKLDFPPVFQTDESEVGTLKQYQVYHEAISFISRSGLQFGTWFNINTPKKVQSILESYRRSGEDVRIFYGDAETGRDWMEENDVIGRIGRSTGVMKIPLLVAKDENGGGGLLDHCIVRMIDVVTHKEVYRHPKYHQAKMDICPATCGDGDGYTHAVTFDGNVAANFKSIGAAAFYISFLSGDCMTTPRE